MTATLGFTASLISTVLVLLLVVLTGRASKRRQHLTLVAVAVVLLGITIYYAEKLGEEYDLESAGVITPIHLTMAKLTVFAYLAPVVTGIMTLRNIRMRKIHGRIAYVILALTGATFATGLAMILAAEPLATN